MVIVTSKKIVTQEIKICQYLNNIYNKIMNNLSVGKLYYFDRPDKDQTSFEEKLKLLLAEYQNKYNWDVDTCMIHPSTLNSENIQDNDTVLGVKIVFYAAIMKDYFWFLDENKPKNEQNSEE